jgi:hypothetical protein
MHSYFLPLQTHTHTHTHTCTRTRTHDLLELIGAEAERIVQRLKIKNKLKTKYDLLELIGAEAEGIIQRLSQHHILVWV